MAIVLLSNFHKKWDARLRGHDSVFIDKFTTNDMSCPRRRASHVLFICRINDAEPQ